MCLYHFEIKNVFFTMYTPLYASTYININVSRISVLQKCFGQNACARKSKLNLSTFRYTSSCLVFTRRHIQSNEPKSPVSLVADGYRKDKRRLAAKTQAKPEFKMHAWLANSSDEPIIGSCDRACIFHMVWLALVVLKPETAAAATDKLPWYLGVCNPCLACFPKPP